MNVLFESGGFEEKIIFLKRITGEIVRLYQTVREMMVNVGVMHHYYLEIFVRLMREPCAPVRIIRKYLIDYYVLIRFALREIDVVRNGRLRREFDVVTTPLEFVHTTLRGSFADRNEVDEVLLSLRSLHSFQHYHKVMLKLSKDLNLDINTSGKLQATLDNLSTGVGKVRFGLKNWEVELVSMFDHAQQLLLTKLCYGYSMTTATGSTSYNLEWIPEGNVFNKFPTLRIPPSTALFLIENNASVTKYNLDKLFIPDAYGYSTFTDILQNQNFVTGVLSDVKIKVFRSEVYNYEQGRSNMAKNAIKSGTILSARYNAAVDAEMLNFSDDVCYWKV
jgi:hypothetical protein